MPLRATEGLVQLLLLDLSSWLLQQEECADLCCAGQLLWSAVYWANSRGYGPRR